VVTSLGKNLNEKPLGPLKLKAQRLSLYRTTVSSRMGLRCWAKADVTLAYGIPEGQGKRCRELCKGMYLGFA
jgi:hypothetical protein